jgi:ribonuclease HII
MVLLGLDEVGTGAWAGPVYVGGCILTPALRWRVRKRFKDPKKMSATRREDALAFLVESDAWLCVESMEAWDMEKVGLSRALDLLFTRIIETARASFGPLPIILDGMPRRGISYRHQTMVGGDDKVPEIMAAALVAKVERDREMVKLSHVTPGYGWKNNKGYGTKAHKNGLVHLGITEQHRNNRGVRKVIGSPGPFLVAET